MSLARNSLLLFVFTLCFFAFSFSHTSAATIVAADVVSDTTWTMADSPYFISNSIRITPGTKLTIDPGVIVQFEYGTEIDVDGELNSNGTSENKVYFTSINDSSLLPVDAGEESDEEELIFEPFAGDYAGFVFSDGSNGAFTHSEIRYASTAVLGAGATLIFHDSAILHSYDGLHVEGGSLTLTDSVFSMSDRPVLVDYSTLFTHSRNTFTDNTYNGIGMIGDPFGHDYTYTAGDAPYILFSSPSFSAGTTLTIEPDVTLRSGEERTAIELIGANFSALGIEDKKIVLDGITLDIFDHANATVKDIEIKNTYWSAINIWDYGSLDADALVIDSVPNDGIDVFLNGSLSLKNSTISNFGSRSGGIVVFNDANATISNTVIDTGGDGIVPFNHATIDADHVTIRNCRDAGVISFGTSDFEDTVIKMRVSEMSGCMYGIYPSNHTILDVSKNSIHNNTYGAYADFGTYDLANNWWGDASGPKNIDTNPEGLGNEIYGPITFSPWRKRDPLLPSKTPILIVPGVLGTEISRPITGGSETLWLDLVHNLTDIGDQFMDALQFGPDLKPIDTSLVLGEVIKKKSAVTPFGELKAFVYTDGLINALKGQGYSENEDLYLFPYDWRYGVSSETIDQLKQKITEIKEQTDNEKVNVIAHSTGGLLIKKYVIDNPTNHSIDKAVFVGVPNTGAPKAIKALVQGDTFGVIPLAESEMKKIAENLPVVYDLSPSEQYFNQKGSYIKIIEQKPFSSVSRLLDFDQSNQLLTDNHSLNSVALTNAHLLHTPDFDNFDLRTAGVDMYAIDGCKKGTIGKVVEVHTKTIFGTTVTSYNAPIEIPGDGTVPFESATNLPIDSDHKYYALKSDHAKMMSADGIREQIVNLLTGSLLDTKNILTQDISKCKLKGRAISIYSPLSIDIIDQDGNHAGFVSESESIENTIPNADYQIMGEHKFVYLPDDEGQAYTITVKGTGSGAFTLTDASIINNLITQTQVFKNIPVTTMLAGTFNLGDVTLTLDTDGDGAIDQTLHPALTLDAAQSEDYNPQQEDQPQEQQQKTTVVTSHLSGHPADEKNVVIKSDEALSHPELVSEPIGSQFAAVFNSPPVRVGVSRTRDEVVEGMNHPELVSGSKVDQSLLSANASSSNFPINKKVILISIGGLGILYFVVRKFIK